jgi:hypothetical protein
VVFVERQLAHFALWQAELASIQIQQAHHRIAARQFNATNDHYKLLNALNRSIF